MKITEHVDIICLMLTAERAWTWPWPRIRYGIWVKIFSDVTTGRDIRYRSSGNHRHILSQVLRSSSSNGDPNTWAIRDGHYQRRCGQIHSWTVFSPWEICTNLSWKHEDDDQSPLGGGLRRTDTSLVITRSLTCSPLDSVFTMFFRSCYSTPCKHRNLKGMD